MKDIYIYDLTITLEIVSLMACVSFARSVDVEDTDKYFALFRETLKEKFPIDSVDRIMSLFKNIVSAEHDRSK